ncbi:MAG: class I SAM-dependent methyltransferase [Brevundimonas sp.]|uniref:class I SAM-dependent methyltransferase n=1 Tax=Brevundimonas sp. TaxID=1871086 RepID=UPI004033B61D
MSDEALERFIRERMDVAPAPGVPEVRLHLAGPSSGLARRFGAEAAEPYWAFVWGGGLALARHLLDRPAVVTGRRVLDLGSGSGLVAIAAMQAGAASVVAVDVDPRAAVAARLNAELNGVVVETMTADLLDGPGPEGVDIVLVGDLFYVADLAERALGFLRRCRDAGVEVLIGDPGRKTLPVEALEQVGAAPGRDFGGAAQGGGVYRLR